jgi:hypothetical protein
MIRHNPMNLDAAVSAAERLLEERHPEAARPAWFARAVFQRVIPLDPRRIEVRYIAERVVALKPHQFWESSPTGRKLIEIDPDTGVRYAVITRDTGAFVDLFAVVYDIQTRSADVVVDTDLESMDPESIERSK